MTKTTSPASVIHSRRGGVAAVVLTTLIAGVFAGALFVRSMGEGSIAPDAAFTTPEALATLAHRLGLEPRGMAAAGFNRTQTETVMTRLRDQAAELVPALELADQAFVDAYTERDRLLGLIQSGSGTLEDPSLLAAAEARLFDATAARAAWLLTTLTGVTNGINDEALRVVQSVRDAHSFDNAVYFAAATRDDASFVLLRDALATEQFARATGEPVPEDAARAIVADQSIPIVATARANFDANYVAVADAWNVVVGR